MCDSGRRADAHFRDDLAKAWAYSMVTRSFGRLSEGRLFGLDFGDWIVLVGGSAVIGLVTLLV